MFPKGTFSRNPGAYEEFIPQRTITRSVSFSANAWIPIRHRSGAQSRYLAPVTLVFGPANTDTIAAYSPGICPHEEH